MIKPEDFEFELSDHKDKYKICFNNIIYLFTTLNICKIEVNQTYGHYVSYICLPNSDRTIYIDHSYFQFYIRYDKENDSLYLIFDNFDIYSVINFSFMLNLINKPKWIFNPKIEILL